MSSEAVHLENLSWKEILDLQEEGLDMLILPTGATEQHGPHLPINTDTVIGSKVTEYASALTGVPVMPAIAYTVSSVHTAKWPGTFSLRHETFIDLLEDIVDWAGKTGWGRILIVNSHFGNDASMRVAVEKLRLKHLGKIQLAALNTFKLSPEIWAEFAADAEDLHANKAETDLMLYLAPETVSMERAVDDPDRTGGTVFSYPVAQTSLNGLTGAPTKGNAADGERLFRMMGDQLASLILKAKDETPPLEAGHWSDLVDS